MKKIIIGMLLILACNASAMALTFDEAKLQDKPIVVFFSESYCGACRQFAPIFEKISSGFQDKFNFVKENASASGFASKLNITSVPTVAIINPKTNSAKKISDNCIWDEACFEKTLQSYNK